MKIAYGTYALPQMMLEDAFPALAQIGYDGVELFIGPRHVGAMLDDFDPARREQLRSILERTGLGLPAFMVYGSVYAPDRAAHLANLEAMRLYAQLARDLGMAEPPVLACGFGGRADEWDTIKEQMVEALADYAVVAEEEGFIFAGEAHSGAAVDRSERVVWLLDEVNHPRARFHFDIVHLFLAGEPIDECVRTLVPYTAHTHIMDARRYPDGSRDLLLLGDGDLDTVAYLRAMDEAGWDDFITLEFSTLIWGSDDYDAMAAARHSYETLTRAFAEAGVART